MTNVARFLFGMMCFFGAGTSEVFGWDYVCKNDYGVRVAVDEVAGKAAVQYLGSSREHDVVYGHQGYFGHIWDRCSQEMVLPNGQMGHLNTVIGDFGIQLSLYESNNSFLDRRTYYFHPSKPPENPTLQGNDILLTFVNFDFWGEAFGVRIDGRIEPELKWSIDHAGEIQDLELEPLTLGGHPGVVVFDRSGTERRIIYAWAHNDGRRALYFVDDQEVWFEVRSNPIGSGRSYSFNWTYDGVVYQSRMDGLVYTPSTPLIFTLLSSMIAAED